MTLPVPWNRLRSRNTACKTNLKNDTITDTKYQNGLHKQIIATPKLTDIRSNKRYIATFTSFLAFLDLARPNNCRIPCLFAQATRDCCPLLCDVILAGAVGQETYVENNRVTSPPPLPAPGPSISLAFETILCTWIFQDKLLSKSRPTSLNSETTSRGDSFIQRSTNPLSAMKIFCSIFPHSTFFSPLNSYPDFFSTLFSSLSFFSRLFFATSFTAERNVR